MYICERVYVYFVGNTCMCIYAHVCMYTQITLNTLLHLSLPYVHTNKSQIYIHMCFVWVCKRVYVRVFVCVYVRECVYVCVRVCVCVHIPGTCEKKRHDLNDVISETQVSKIKTKITIKIRMEPQINCSGLHLVKSRNNYIVFRNTHTEHIYDISTTEVCIW